MNVSTVTIKEGLQKYRHQAGLNMKELADEAGIEYCNIYGILKMGRNPQPKNKEAMVDFLQKKGILSPRRAMPTDLGAAMKEDALLQKDIDTMSETEKKALESIGIKPWTGSPNGDKELNAIQDEWQIVVLVHAIADSRLMDTGMKKRLIGKLLPSVFPQLKNHL